MIAIADTNGVITYVNDKFCELYQYSREEVLGKTHRLFKSGEHPDEFYENLWKTISSGRIWRGEVRNRAKDGSLHWAFMTIVPFLDRQGKPYQHVSIRADITPMMKAEEERVRLIQAQADAERARHEVEARNRTRLEQLMINLLTHAMKYGRGKPIEISARERDDRAVVEVTDHGIGIPKDFQSQLFQRFERAEAVEKFKGVGLGLWICQQIVRAHHGTLRVESKEGKCATFIVELPRRPSDPGFV